MKAELAERGTPSPAQEQAWVAAAQMGDRAASSHLVEAYWPRLYRWLHHLTHDRHAAEDLAQEAFCKALSHLGRFQAGTNFRAWLFRIAHNTLSNQRRAAAGRRAPLPDDLPAHSPGPEQEAVGREALAKLGEAVKLLPAEFRAALLLRVDEELSFRQIAAVVGTTEETARWRVFKARQKLLECLDTETEP
jgi:RNA polymerase sigma-70 factor (ECF subfamily)